METIVGKDIKVAAEWIRKGEVVAIPTETVYGLAGNALNDDAVHSIFRVKNRPLGNPLILHLYDRGQLNNFVKYIPTIAYDLMDQFAPGPLTFLLPKKESVSDLITSGSPLVAIRFPDHKMTRMLLKELDLPIAAPSANKYTAVSPTLASHVLQQLGGEIPYILDGGPCKRGIESTVIGFENDTIVIYRPGTITEEQFIKSGYKVRHKSSGSGQMHSPGMAAHHYSPRTKLLLVVDPESAVKNFSPEKTGVISFSKPVTGIPFHHQFILSEKGNLEEAASRLYAALHLMDEMNLDVIVAQIVPDSEIGKAINDRLRRASAQ